MHQPILMTNSRHVRLPWQQQQQLAHLRQAADRCCCGSAASSSCCSAFSDEAIASAKVLRTVPLTSKINTSWTNWDTVSNLLCRGETLPLYPYSSSSSFLLESMMRTRSSSPGSVFSLINLFYHVSVAGGRCEECWSEHFVFLHHFLVAQLLCKGLYNPVCLSARWERGIYAQARSFIVAYRMPREELSSKVSLLTTGLACTLHPPIRVLFLVRVHVDCVQISKNFLDFSPSSR